MDSVIDIVIMWVDDQDYKWKEKKRYWQGEEKIKDNQEERYRSWDNLHYLFRGIEKFAPWVNHVFLVTDNQKPDWLNDRFEKVTVIDHKDIIDEKYLPTFNSSAIELNIHKISNLSENFIYFNDDIFLIDHTSPEDFFINGIPKDMGVLNAITPIKANRVSNVIFNNVAIINENFNIRDTIRSHPLKWINYNYGISLISTFLLLRWERFTGFHNHHLMTSFNKKTFELIWEKYEPDLIKTTKNRFRDKEDNNQWLMRYWQLASNNFIPRKKSFGKYFGITDQKSTKECVNHIINQKTKVICVNDNELLENFVYSKEQVNKSFEKLLAEKSQFEK